MPTPIYRNTVQITFLKFKDNTQFAFGIILEIDPRVCFFPHWIVKGWGIRKEDIGVHFDCLFIEQDGGRDPMVIGIIEEGDLKPSQEIGALNGAIGTQFASMKIGDLPGADKIKSLVRNEPGRKTLYLKAVANV
jgi:hypothetical protein